MAYLQDVIFYRHFWTHLAFSDLRARFRRSHLGLLWVPLNPLLLTLVIAGVLHLVFDQEFTSFSIYVLSGLIVWEFITGTINIGSSSFIAAEGYVKQVRLPMVIYPLKATLYCLLIFALSLAGFALYALILQPQLLSWHWLHLFPFMLFLGLLGLPLAIISAVINIKFRDFQQFIGILLQIVWYASPVFLPRHVFDNPLLAQWTAINPIAALMDLFRQPILHGMSPTWHSYQILGL